jgi:hypothetical protein
MTNRSPWRGAIPAVALLFAGCAFQATSLQRSGRVLVPVEGALSCCRATVAELRTIKKEQPEYVGSVRSFHVVRPARPVAQSDLCACYAVPASDYSPVYEFPFKTRSTFPPEPLFPSHPADRKRR